jgi:methionine synthase II (cobalamin-independent)
MAPPFHADQIGSLLRPPELFTARAESGLNSSYKTSLSEEIKLVTWEAIVSAVQKQLLLSISPITSGEYSRYIF